MSTIVAGFRTSGRIHALVPAAWMHPPVSVRFNLVPLRESLAADVYVEPMGGGFFLQIVLTGTSVAILGHSPSGLEPAVLILTDPDGRQRHVVSSGEQVLFSEDVVQQVIAQKKSLLVGYDFEASGTMIKRGIHSAICAPLLKEPQLMGVIYLEDSIPGKFGEEELIVLTLFANQVAAGIDNVTLSENLQKELNVRSNLERFLSPRVVELVTKDCLDKGEIFLQTERVEASILFTDIKGFTMLSESLDPQEGKA